MLDIKLIKFVDKNDNYELMYKWCSNKNVYRWFEQRILSREEIKTKYKNKLSDKYQSLFFIVYNGEKIGFVQIYKYNGKKIEELHKYSNIYEYDIFIGEDKYISKGIGTHVVKYINKYIYKNYSNDCIVLRVFKQNVGAIKCYQKAGFNIVKEYVDVDTLGKKEKCVIMINKNDILSHD